MNKRRLCLFFFCFFYGKGKFQCIKFGLFFTNWVVSTDKRVEHFQNSTQLIFGTLPKVCCSQSTELCSWNPAEILAGWSRGGGENVKKEGEGGWM